jgi:hypothetical protein
MINLPVVEHVSRLVIELASRTKAEYDAEEDAARDEAEEVTLKRSAMEFTLTDILLRVLP